LDALFASNKNLTLTLTLRSSQRSVAADDELCVENDIIGSAC
jgi:hypothetical protein